MMNLILIIGIICLGVCLADWRKGVLVCIAAGFLQDPIRKLIPGEPVYLSALAGVFVIATIFGFIIQRGLISFKPIHSWYGVLRMPLYLFMGLVIIQAGFTIVRFGKPILALIGTVSYLAPIPALLLAYYYPKSAEDIKKLAVFYVVMCILAASGVYFNYFGFNLPALRQVGPGLTIYDVGMILKPYPGFLRSPEVMAWHATTGACILAVLFMLTSKGKVRFGCGILILFLIIAGILTGRRKILIQAIFFLSFYGFLIIYSQQNVRKLFTYGILLTGILAALALKTWLPTEKLSEFNPYWQRGMTVFSDAPTRFEKLGFGSVEWAFRRGGVFGKGAGTGSQGAQHFGGGTELVGGASEGGLGKIMVELGAPGLILALWITAAFALYLWRIIVRVQSENQQLAILTYGFIAFLVSSIPMFIVASQAYGDPFVLLTLGYLAGFVLSVPRIFPVRDAGMSASQSVTFVKSPKLLGNLNR